MGAAGADDTGSDGTGAGAAPADTWWERDERGTAYTELAGARV